VGLWGTSTRDWKNNDDLRESASSRSVHATAHENRSERAQNWVRAGFENYSASPKEIVDFNHWVFVDLRRGLQLAEESVRPSA
jgi:hypothetical protein